MVRLATTLVALAATAMLVVNLPAVLRSLDGAQVRVTVSAWLVDLRGAATEFMHEAVPSMSPPPVEPERARPLCAAVPQLADCPAEREPVAAG